MTLRKIILIYLALSFSLPFSGCAGMRRTQTEADRPDPLHFALMTLSEAGVAVNRRRFRLAEKDPNSRLAFFVSPRSDLSRAVNMDFSWRGEAGEAVLVVAGIIGWSGKVENGAGLGIVSVPEKNGLRLMELLFSLSLQLESQGEVLEVDEFLRELRIVKKR
ncbi:MAG: hypothetical protein LBR53_01470 [Deltaproteobacteria bacterium]|jgi:hypothetical protein|nr:hypothetical protein [Deltaproteobacteria bacterium]